MAQHPLRPLDGGILKMVGIKWHGNLWDPWMTAMATPDNVEVHASWGLTEIFGDISEFLLLLEREYAIANQAFTEYAVGRPAVCLRSINYLASVVSEAGEDASDLVEYLSDL